MTIFRKIWIWVIVGSLLLVIASWLFIFPIGVGIDGCSFSTDSGMSLPAGRLGSVSSPLDDHVYILSEYGVLKRIGKGCTNNIAMLVERALPIDQGVIYTNWSGTLHLKNQDKTVKIAKNVDAFGWDGKRVLYCSDGGLFSWIDGETRYITELPDIDVAFLYANDKNIIFESSTDLYLCNENGTSKEIDIHTGSPNRYILFGDYLVIIGSGKLGAEVYHLPTGAVQPLDIGWYAAEHFNTISATCDGKNIYLSMHSKTWPKVEEEINTGTFRIDPESWTIEEISPNFYDSLAYIDGMLYGLDLSTFSGEWSQIP